MAKNIKINHSQAHQVKSKYNQVQLQMFLDSSVNDYTNTNLEGLKNIKKATKKLKETTKSLVTKCHDKSKILPQIADVYQEFDNSLCGKMK